MKPDVRIITGPSTAKVSKAQAEEKLRSHPDFPKNASFELEALEGRWIAAIASVKEAGPFDAPGDAPDAPPELDGPPSDDAPSDDAPSDDAPKEDAPSDDDKPKDDKGDKKSLESQVEHLTELLTTVVDALGLGGDASPVPGSDDPHGGPDGPPPPPAGDEGTGDGKSHTVHERALKPGEAPPGTTPLGSPAFASTHPDHPWAAVIGEKKSFSVESPIGDQKLADVRAELQRLTEDTGGYQIKQLVEARDASGQRIARALVAKA
jgi:hypothetical protein